MVNAGSSSVKLRMVEADDSLSAHADLGPPGPDLADAIAGFLAQAQVPDAFAHRVVHGGSQHTAPLVVDQAARASLQALEELAPLHNPPAMAGIGAVLRIDPGRPCVACFDTAFHATLTDAAATYAVPADWRERWGIRRFGFHGLSCAWSVRRMRELLGPAASGARMAVCHLGSGASVTAISAGRSVDTTMGFTPLEGLVMATRPGDLDAGVVLWALRHGLDASEVEEELEHGSGLAGLVGGSAGDMRAVLGMRGAGDEKARRAIEVYLHRLRSKVASMAAAAGGLDVLVFTGGVGENAPSIREECCERLGWLGVAIDPQLNRDCEHDTEISAPGAVVRTFVVHAREDLVMADEARRALAG